MSKLLFFDIDGTLIAENHQIPSSVVPAMERAREKGCLLFINTGRTLCNIDPRVQAMPMDGMITGCGSRVICQGKTLRAMEYPLRDSLRIRDIFRAHRIPAVYECDTGMYFDPEGSSWPMIEDFRKFSDLAGLTRIISETDEAFRAVKMFAFSRERAPIDRLLQDLAAAGYPFDAIDRGDAGWEIVPGGCSKAEGIEVVRQALGISLEDCYAFGDSSNDETMLTHIPNSIAMGNAPAALKQKCRFVTARPEEDGIALAMDLLGLI